MDTHDSSRHTAIGQRDRVFRKHHGFVRAKRCGFCWALSHVDEQGLEWLPWRLHPSHRPILTWYCCTQCAQQLDWRKEGWHRHAPGIPPYSIRDEEPQLREPLQTYKPVPQSKPEEWTQPSRVDWAEDSDEAIKFGSF